MSSWFAAIHIDNNVKLKNEHKHCLNNNYYPRHILKPKNIFKSKCDKELKKKLKKYKLRKDGQEDQDVIDVSHTFLTVLKIKSPNSKLLHVSSDDDIELRPKNYLFNMAKKKHRVVSQESETILETTPLTLNQDKRTTDAFKLMMDSRNKSIGGNSPGKEKFSDASENQEVIEKKELKAKRNLVLQKLAESKGSLKKKEIEDYEEQCIKIKMEKRAERLKNMIKKTAKHRKLKERTRKIKTEDGKGDKTPKQKVQLIDLFNDDSLMSNKSDDCILSDVKLKQKSKEDEEFLKKLSPSIRKKENMLCYFKKIDKTKSVDIDNPHGNCSENVIKVKVTPINKNKKLRKKLSLNKQSDDILKDHDENKFVAQNKEICNEAMVTPTESSVRRKRKRKENSEDICCGATEANILLQNNSSAEVNEVTEGGRRSKRSIRKPIKYIDDIELSSSDEELHIFTPKKLKPLEGKTTQTKRIRIKKEIHVLDIEENNPVQEEKKVSKKAPKLAPIFNAKPQLTPEEIEAKQKFLYSGVPVQLKKIITQQTKNTPDLVNCHPVVVHIQQKSVEISSPLCYDLQLDDSTDEDDEISSENISFSKFLTLLEKQTQIFEIFTATENAETILQNIKNSYPKFPVYRTYGVLRGKCKGDFKGASCSDFENSTEPIKELSDIVIVNENPDNLSWTDKYKALSTNQLIGNFEAVKDLKKWLVSWTENEMKPRKSTVNDSDSSDFCYDSDVDSRDSMKTTDNLLIISGPVGCGKSFTVYTVAAELAIKVIEVNASSKRTGKMMLQDLQEATQSHKVNRGTSSIENSQKSQEILEKPLKTYKNKRIPKKVYENGSKITVAKNIKRVPSSVEITQGNARTAMSLILVDDADIVFDQDDGFSSAVAQLVHTSKRPVVLITSSLSCLHLQKFIQCGRVLNMHPLLPRMLGTWLDILCLADRSMCWQGLGAKFLDHFKGDIRKTINTLQFYLSSEVRQPSQVNICSQNTDINIEDECSSLSWAEKEGVDEKVIKRTNNELKHRAWKYFMGDQINSLENFHSSELFSVWWSIPSLLNPIYRNDDIKSEEKPTAQYSLENVAKVLETLSVADYFSQIDPDRQENICSQPWREFESDSVSELEDLNNYSSSKYLNKEILHSFVRSSILLAQKSMQMETKTDIEQPGILEQRRRNKKISRHDCLTSFLNPSSVLDRKALALDYWSTCRSICRIEKTKTDVVSKRNNRFCHYLKCMSVVCKTDSLHKLCDNLSSSSNVE